VLIAEQGDDVRARSLISGLAVLMNPALLAKHGITESVYRRS